MKMRRFGTICLFLLLYSCQSPNQPDWLIQLQQYYGGEWGYFERNGCIRVEVLNSNRLEPDSDAVLDEIDTIVAFIPDSIMYEKDCSELNVVRATEGLLLKTSTRSAYRIGP